MTQADYLAFSEIDWDDIIDTMEVGKCILFLGQEAYLAPGGGNMEEGLIDWLDARNPEHPQIATLLEDGFLQFRKERLSYTIKVANRISEFFNQPFPESRKRFEKLAEIPFSMIFSMVPDNILAQTYDTLGLDYQHGYYSHNRVTPEPEWAVSNENPLIYNILGNIEDPESLILTQNDFYTYLEKTVAAKKQMRGLLDQLEQAERFIFLGLPYNKWHFQLLMRVLSMHTKEMGKIERLGLNKFEDEKLHKLFSKDFKIEFVPDSIDKFIETFHQKCEEAGITKKVAPPDPHLATLPDPSFKELILLLSEGDTRETFLQLEIFLNRRKPGSKKMLDRFIVLYNQFNLLKKHERKGTIDSRDANVEHNQIVEKLVAFIRETESQYPQTI
ncbi:MAG: SIR2 family protein [Saprospiraceae bacterium]|nr:SIR2 family protein [Saprospiraceae bacterium]